MIRLLRRQHGFTLVDTVIGMAILTAISLALGGTFLVAGRSLSNEARTIAADTAISHASFTLTRDLASASPVPTGRVSAAPSTTLNLTYGSPPVAVVYSIDGNGDLVRTAGGSAQVAARGISSVVVVVTSGCYLTATIQPSASGAAPVTLNVGNRPGGCF